MVKSALRPPRRSFRQNWRKHRIVYMMFIPVLIYYIVFHYLPMCGIVIGFQNYIPSRGILASKFVGLKHFKSFFNSYYFERVIRNTFLISFYSILFGFPAPILLALLLNELKQLRFKKIVQSITYMPHFLSIVVVCGMVLDFCASDGLISSIVVALGGTAKNYAMYPEYFRTIYIASDIWTSIGWGSIVYLAALSGIDPSLYEAARVDGAGRFRQLIHITLPGIMPTIVTLFILRVGNIMGVGHEKIILLYNSLTYETADVISTFVYRKGLIESNFGYSTAIGLFNSVINFGMVFLANTLSRKVNESSLW